MVEFRCLCNAMLHGYSNSLLINRYLDGRGAPRKSGTNALRSRNNEESMQWSGVCRVYQLFQSHLALVTIIGQT